MKTLIIKGDFKHPQIKFNAANGILELIGNSIPDEAEKFYTPIIEWIKNYSQNPNNTTTLNLKLIYLNSASKKHIFDIFDIIKSCEKNVTINWYYEQDDEDMLEVGESYKELLNLSINFIPV